MRQKSVNKFATIWMKRKKEVNSNKLKGEFRSDEIIIIRDQPGLIIISIKYKNIC